MIKFFDLERLYRIQFQYRDQKHTYCIISLVNLTDADKDLVRKDLRIFTHRSFDVYEWSGGLQASFGRSRCSKSDVFQRDIGRKKALARALTQFPRESRAAAWMAYLNRKESHAVR